MVSKKFAKEVLENNPVKKSGIYSSYPPPPHATTEMNRHQNAMSELVTHFNTKKLPVSNFNKSNLRKSASFFKGIQVEFL